MDEDITMAFYIIQMVHQDGVDNGKMIKQVIFVVYVKSYYNIISFDRPFDFFNLIMIVEMIFYKKRIKAEKYDLIEFYSFTIFTVQWYMVDL